MSQADLLKSVFRSDPAEGPGDQRPEAEDSGSDGRHAQHLLHSRHQQHDPRGPPLLLKVYGHQSLQPGPQRLRLPASQKVNASPALAPVPFTSPSIFLSFLLLQARNLTAENLRVFFVCFCLGFFWFGSLLARSEGCCIV